MRDREPSGCQRHIGRTVLGLLDAPWILDVDVTVKPLYGKQQGAVVGYNPHKPGRPSHAYHSYQVSGLRLMLGVDVLAGNQSHANHTLTGTVSDTRWFVITQATQAGAWGCGNGR